MSCRYTHHTDKTINKFEYGAQCTLTRSTPETTEEKKKNEIKLILSVVGCSIKY